MFDPLTIGVGALIWAAFRKSSNKQFGVYTPEREELYQKIMQDRHILPQTMIQYAGEFEKNGLKAQGFWIRKRAEWRSRSPKTRAEHDAIFKKAMESENVEAILNCATIFENMTATWTAGQLRERAKSLTAAKSKTDMSGHNPEKSENDGLPQNSAAAE